MPAQDEGYIKFRADHQPGPPLPAAFLTQLQHWRQRLYEQGLIGAYPDGIGYGNLSCRYQGTGQFIISGTATGGLAALEPKHYALVTDFDPDTNALTCTGPILASSESMTHGILYRHCPEVGGVLHVHSLPLWQKLLHRVPTTDADAPYGSPEMVYSVVRLLKETDLRRQKIFVMEGHREGVFAFGKDLEEAGAVLEQWGDWVVGPKQT